MYYYSTYNKDHVPECWKFNVQPSFHINEYFFKYWIILYHMCAYMWLISWYIYFIYIYIYLYASCAWLIVVLYRKCVSLKKVVTRKSTPVHELWYGELITYQYHSDKLIDRIYWWKSSFISNDKNKNSLYLISYFTISNTYSVPCSHFKIQKTLNLNIYQLSK